MTASLFTLLCILLAFTSLTNGQNCTALANAGDCSFYDCLSNKFGCNSNGYPVAYGKRYCQRFEIFKNCFTTNGQTWMTNFRTCQMRAIINNPAYTDPNTTCDQLETIGFESHRTCYLDNGFCPNVLNSSKNLICLGNDVFIFRDPLSRQGLNEVLETASHCPQNYITQFLQSVGNFISQSEEFLGTLRDYLGSCTSGIDMIFLMDSSGSIQAANFATMRNFVANVIDNFDIAPDATRVGVISFSSTASVVIPLGSINNKASLMNTVNSIPYPGGGTRTDLALNLLPTAFANARVSEGVPRVAIVLTDGQSNQPALTVQSSITVHDAGITVYSFGIGNNIMMSELLTISGNNSRNVFLISNFSPDSFSTQLQPLRASTCTTPFPGEIGIELEGITLQRSASRLLQYNLPSQGLSLSLKIRSGNVRIRGSYYFRNPTALTNDFTFKSDDYDNELEEIIFFVLFSARASSDRTGTGGGSLNQTRNVYLSIIGLSDGNNTFSLNTTLGDIRPSAGVKLGGGVNLTLLIVMVFTALTGFYTVIM